MARVVLQKESRQPISLRATRDYLAIKLCQNDRFVTSKNRNCDVLIFVNLFRWFGTRIALISEKQKHWAKQADHER